jgi:hypothetical protein
MHSLISTRTGVTQTPLHPHLLISFNHSFIRERVVTIEPTQSNVLPGCQLLKDTPVPKPPVMRSLGGFVRRGAPNCPKTADSASGLLPGAMLPRAAPSAGD